MTINQNKEGYKSKRLSNCDTSIKSPGTIHYPILICIDTSSSMNSFAENGNTKASMMQQMLNMIADIDLFESEKDVIDLCILGCNDKCYVFQDWISLSELTGNIDLNMSGNAVIGNAIVESIDAIRARRQAYMANGVESSKAQIFLFTDSVSNEDLKEAITYAEKYLNRDKPFVTLNIFLIPPATDSSKFKVLGDKVRILCLKDSINGIENAFIFLRNIVCERFCTHPGEEIKVKIGNLVDIDFVNLNFENENISDSWD